MKSKQLEEILKKIPKEKENEAELIAKEYTDREKAELAALMLSTFSDLSKEVDCEGEMAALISRSPMDFPYGAVEKIDTIGDYAFQNAIFNDTDIVIPNNVTTIGQYAFMESNATSLTIPDSVTNIGMGAIKSDGSCTVYCSLLSYAAEYCNNNYIPVVSDDNFVSVSVETMPNVTVYPLNSKIDTWGLSLRAVTDDGREGITSLGFTLGEYSFSTPGTKTITVYLGEVSTQFEVFVDETLPAWPESEHPYANNSDITWTYTHPQAAGMLMFTFSDKCYLADGDSIIVKDGNGYQVSAYYGTDAAGASNMIGGNTFTIELHTNDEGVGYGFSIDSTDAY